MATISKTWGSDTDIEGTTGSPITMVDVTEQYSDDVDLETSGYEGAHVQVRIVFGATGANDADVKIKIYGSTNTTYTSSVADSEFAVAFVSSTTKIVSFIVRDYAHFRLGFQQSGTSTNDATIWAHQQSWRWDST